MISKGYTEARSLEAAKKLLNLAYADMTKIELVPVKTQISVKEA